MKITIYIVACLFAFNCHAMPEDEYTHTDLCYDLVYNFENVDSYLNNKFYNIKTVHELMTSLSEFGIGEIRILKIPTLNSDDKINIVNGHPIYLEGYAVVALFRCHINDGNVNIIEIDFIISKDGKLKSMSWYLFYDDENFLSRNIDISYDMFCSKDSFVHAILGVAKYKYRNGVEFLKYIKRNKFDVSEIEKTESGEYFFTIKLSHTKKMKKRSIIKKFYDVLVNNVVRVSLDKNMNVISVGNVRFE